MTYQAAIEFLFNSLPVFQREGLRLISRDWVRRLHLTIFSVIRTANMQQYILRVPMARVRLPIHLQQCLQGQATGPVFTLHHISLISESA